MNLGVAIVVEINVHKRERGRERERDKETEKRKRICFPKFEVFVFARLHTGWCVCFGSVG